MKYIFIFCFAFFAIISNGAYAAAADSTGLPGDNFDLEGALELFKNSNSLEEFERKINEESSNINNLDLNEDGEVDYIKVDDYMEGNVHAIVLRTPISESEVQDVAVIEIEKTGDNSAIIQIVGDEDLYGSEKMVEPFEARSSDNQAVGSSTHVSVNVWAWPAVGYVFMPGYVVYRSAYRWRYYPTYWRPWRPVPVSVVVVRPRPYRTHFRVVHVRRVVHAPVIYRPYRSTSVIVKSRYPQTKVKRTTAVSTHPRRVNTVRKMERPAKTRAVKTTEKRDKRARVKRSRR